MRTLTSNIDDTLGCGEQDILLGAHDYSGRRFGDLKVQEKSRAQAGVELSAARDFSAHFAPGSSAKALDPIPTAPT